MGIEFVKITSCDKCGLAIFDRSETKNLSLVTNPYTNTTKIYILGTTPVDFPEGWIPLKNGELLCPVCAKLYNKLAKNL